MQEAVVTRPIELAYQPYSVSLTQFNSHDGIQCELMTRIDNVFNTSTIVLIQQQQQQQSNIPFHDLVIKLIPKVNRKTFKYFLILQVNQQHSHHSITQFIDQFIKKYNVLDSVVYISDDEFTIQQINPREQSDQPLIGRKSNSTTTTTTTTESNVYEIKDNRVRSENGVEYVANEIAEFTRRRITSKL